MTEGEFSVCQFFENGTYEYVRRFVSAQDAVEAAYFFASSVGAQIGTTQSVIITDGLDCVSWEWQYGKGIVFPPSVAAPGVTP